VSLLTVMHMSDLHICEETLREDLARLSQIATREAGLEVSIGIADRPALQSVKNAVNEVDPDVICVTGDITTFGDALSFQQAGEFLEDIRERGAGREPRKIIVTPGNHDVLCSHLSFVLKMKGLEKIAVKWFKLPRTTSALRRILKRKGVNPGGNNPLANFRDFVDKYHTVSSAIQVGDMAQKPVWCVPFDTVSNDAIWMNAGQTSREEFQSFYQKLREKGRTDSILIALVHHNPISSPDTIEHPLAFAYNSMPGASLLVREMQAAGTDLILFGHQHRFTSCIMDFVPETPSHVHLLGAPSATCGDNRGINVIVIEDRFYARYFSVNFSAVGSFTLPKREDYRPMVFDRDRPFDQLTMCTKGEIKFFRYKDADQEEALWNEMHSPGAKDLIIVGPRLRKLTVGARREQLQKGIAHPENQSIRILLGDPTLYQRILGLKDDDRLYLSAIWGDDYNWEDQAKKAELTLKALRLFRDELPSNLRGKLQVRVTHTLLPIGAVARDIDNPNSGSMLIRLLPVGRLGEIERPIMRLTRRHPEAVYGFYKEYLAELWSKGRNPWLDEQSENGGGQ